MTDNRASRTKFLTVAEVAELLRVSKMTVYRWVHAGEFPAVRFGKSYRVPQQAVEEYLANAGVHAFFDAEDDERSAGAVG